MPVPPPPGIWQIIYKEDNRIDGDADPGGTVPGYPVLQWQVAYGTSPTSPAVGGGLRDLALSTGSISVTGLTPKTIYYFWNRQRNAFGWSDWSARTSDRTRGVPDPTKPPALITRTQTSISLRVLLDTTMPNGDSPITGYQVRYGLDPTGPSFVKYSTTNQVDITGLQPGARYYFWGQAWNAYGEGYYSPRSFADLIAGAKVNVGGTWKRAVPYVKVAGVWRVARPWGRIAGFWNETPE